MLVFCQELDELVWIMRVYLDMQLDIIGYIDNVGLVVINLLLLEK